jgi:hypothetical protein
MNNANELIQRPRKEQSQALPKGDRPSWETPPFPCREVFFIPRGMHLLPIKKLTQLLGGNTPRLNAQEPTQIYGRLPKATSLRAKH